jgi:hypothetical protein
MLRIAGTLGGSAHAAPPEQEAFIGNQARVGRNSFVSLAPAT